MSDRSRMKAIFVVTATVAFVMSPVVSGSFGGFAPEQFPVPQDDPPVQPAGYAFAIWGVIYAWLLVSAVYGLVKRADDAGWDRGRWPLVASLAVGAAWIPVALGSVIWATVLIWVMLAGAVWARLAAPARDRWWLAAPLGLYAGWLTAASAVSVGLVGAGWGIGPGATGWAWIAVVLAVVVAGAVQLRLARGAFYGAAVAWGLAAVAVQNAGSAWTLTVAAGLAAAAILALAVRSERRAG